MEHFFIIFASHFDSARLQQTSKLEINHKNIYFRIEFTKDLF